MTKTEQIDIQDTIRKELRSIETTMTVIHEHQQKQADRQDDQIKTVFKKIDGMHEKIDNITVNGCVVGKDNKQDCEALDGRVSKNEAILKKIIAIGLMLIGAYMGLDRLLDFLK